MKRKFIMRNIIISILLLIIIGGGTYYFVNKNGKKYEIEKVETYNYFLLKQNSQTGVINRNGDTIVEAKYDDIKIPNPEKGIFVCYKGDEIKIINENNKEIFDKYEKVEPIRLKNIASDLMYEKSVLTYYENGKYGLINFEGKKLTKAQYDQIEGLPYKEGELLVKQEDKYGVINIKGKKLINIEYSEITVDGYYTDENGYKYAGYIISNTTQEGYRYGYINYAGKLILKTQYNQLSRITDIEDNETAYLLGAKNGQFGITKNQEEIIKNEYQSISYDEVNKLLLVEKSKKYGIATLKGELIVPDKYNQIDVVGIYIYAKNDQGTIVYNTNGTEANIDTKTSILNTSNEKYKIKIDNNNETKYGVIGKDGKTIIEEKYNYIEYLYENYFIVSKENSKLGVVDDKDNKKIEIENDSIQKVGKTNILQVTIAQNNITKLYSSNLDKICKMQNATLEAKENYIKIYNKDEVKYFSNEGKELKNIEVYENNKIFTKQENNKWGFVDKSGKTIVEYKYDKATEFNEYGFAGVEKDGKWGVINVKGEEIKEPTYELKEGTEPSFIGQYYKVAYGFGEAYYTKDIK